MHKHYYLQVLTFLLLNPVYSQVSQSLEHNGISRTYLYYEPGIPAGPKGRPLILALHGFTQNAATMMTGSGFNSLADQEGFIVIYPDGVNNAWNTNFGLPGGSTVDDFGFMNALIDTFLLHHHVNPQQIYACGFSQGGFMSYALACTIGHRLAAIGSVAGTMTNFNFTSCDPAVSMPVIQLHGTSDFVVNYNGGFGNKSVPDVVNYWVNHNAILSPPVITHIPDTVQEGSTVEKSVYGPGLDSSEVHLLRIIDGGHTWPGYTGFFGIGIVNQDIKAEVELWEFFRRFHRPDAPVEIKENHSLQSYIAFPNPFQETIHFHLPYPHRATLRDIWGRIVAEITEQPMMMTTSLPSGTYILEAHDIRGLPMIHPTLFRKF